jgi:hypothetical protein
MSLSRLFVCCFTLLGLGCQADETRLRAEAQRFVAMYQQVEYDAPAATRSAKLDELEKAVFVSKEVVDARALCLSGHRQLLEAQRGQDQTAEELDKALAGTTGAQPLPPGTVERLQETLKASQTTLGQARRQLEDCEAQTRALDLRFGKR